VDRRAAESAFESGTDGPLVESSSPKRGLVLDHPRAALRALATTLARALSYTAVVRDDARTEMQLCPIGKRCFRRSAGHTSSSRGPGIAVTIQAAISAQLQDDFLLCRARRPLSSHPIWTAVKDRKRQLAPVLH